MNISAPATPPSKVGENIITFYFAMTTRKQQDYISSFLPGHLNSLKNNIITILSYT